MTVAEKSWTGNIDLGSNKNVLFNQLCDAFNASPFYQYCGMQMRVVDGQIEAYVEMQKDLIGNVAFQILHGGVAATILDSIGGITAMGELYKKPALKIWKKPAKKFHVWRLWICVSTIWHPGVANTLLHVQKPCVWGVRDVPCA